jgi:membrane-bound ClpP family serine protease
MIGIVAALCAVGAVIVAFRIGPGYGMSSLGFMAIATPTTFWVGLRVFPYTPVGKRIILSSGSSPEDLQRRESERLAENQSIRALVGAEGVAMTALRPGGTIRIDGVDVEAFAETGMIEAGQAVRIVSTSGRLLKVRSIESRAT